MAKNSLTSSLIYGLFLSILFILNVSTASAQNSSNRGTPAESKPGQSTPSTYARDKIETVNLVNGNFSLAIPIATIGGRGSASFTVVLSYNSKVWTAQHDAEWIPQGDSEFPPIGTVRNYYTAMYEKLEEFEPGLAKLGGGWTIRVTPGIKALTFGIDPAPTTWCNQGTDEVPDCGFKYVLTKMWLSLPDGSQIEMRDQATQGAPARATHITDGYRQLIDRDRGRVWRSVDGSGVIFVRDANYPVGQLTGLHFPSGWIFMTDGTRIRMDEGAGSKMIDRNGNFIDIAMGGQYTDALGRQTTLSFSPNTVAVTVEGYMGTADRTVTINTGAIGDPDNLRADFRTLPRPFTTGDAFTDALGNYSEHTIQAPHTDLFNHSEGIKAYGTSAGVDVGEKTAVTQLNLLDGRSMRFRYNQYGEVSEIVYPGGGVSQIDYLGTATSVCEVSAPIAATLNRRVGQRRTLTDGTNVDATWIYNLNATSVVDGTTYPATLVEIRAGGAAGTLLSSTKHAFLKKGFGSEYRSCFGSYTGTGNEKFGNAREFYTETLTGNGTVVTRRNWVQRAPVVWANDEGLGYNAYINEPSHAQDQPPNDDRITWEDTTLENGKKKRVEYDYDQFNNVTLIKEYDFGNTSGSLGALIRKTYRTYVTNLNSYCYTNLNPADGSCGPGLASDVNSIIYQPGLVLTETIKDANDNQKAYSEFEYDNYSSATNHAALVLNSGMIHYDAIRFSTFNNASQPRGNVTKHSRWVGGSNYLHAFNQYDNAGNLVWTKDPNGNVSTISYGDNFGNGTNPDSGLIGPAGATFAMATGVANALNHQSKVQFNYALGSPTGTKDPNLVKTRTEYDSVGRPIRVTAAVGAPAQTIAETTYPTLTANESTTSSQLDTTRWLASKIVFDEFDRPVTSWQSEDGLHASMATFSIRTNTLYDEIGRVTSISNPYRPAQGETALYTTSVYDLMGRVTSVTTPDNSVVQTSYSSNEVTVTDQIGNKRKSVTDALGRLIQIYEAPDQPTFNYLTTYAYDVLDNLVSVSQGGQMRYFMYDPAKRLIRARNPEQDTHASLALSDVQTGNAQWSMGYQYDANGNLTQKTDSRAIISTYGYDALNRNTTINYSNTTTNPDITRSYDGATKGVGRFWQSYAGGTETAGTTVEHLKIHTYDELGRPKDQRQRFRTNSVWGSTEYRVERTYNLAGNVTLQTYPSNRTAAYSYDNAGRASSASGNLGDGTQRTYATGISYVASGAMKQEQFGTTTPIYNKHIYNSRQQLSEIRVGTTPNDTSWNRGAIINHYAACAGACNGTDNNGNLKRQTIYVSTATGSVNWTQTYDYDSLNRLKKVTERDSNTAQLWKQGYTYDRFGNRTIDPLQTSGTGINNKQFTVNTANNRLGVPVGQTGTMTYDPAGNLTADTYSGSAVTRVYDAENRLTSETQGGGLVVGEYNYTADGQRVRRKVNGLETWQVYGMDGELLAEYAAAGASVSPQKEYGYRNGELLVTTEPSTQTVQNVTWTGAAGVTVNGNSLTKTAGTAWGNAGAASTETIASGDGYVEFTATETNTARMCGLSFGNSNTNYTEIDFAMYPTNAGTVSVYEGGVNRGSFGAYTPGTVFRVAVESGVVKYYRNGAVIYTSTVTPTYPLVVDTAMYTVGATLTNVVIGIGSGPQVQNVTLTGAAGVTVNGNSLTKTAGTAWGNAGAASTETIASGDGYVEFTATETNTARMCGLSFGNSNTNYTEIDFAMYPTNAGTVTVYEGGVNRGSFGAYTPGTVFRVAVESGVVKYYRNGSVIYTSTVTPSYPLLVDTALYTTGATISNVVIGSNGPADITWLVSDHLGTPRMSFDKSGSLAGTKRHDYLPFGEEIFAGTGVRTTGHGYMGDNVRQKFTSKERDNETGLDYFLARYYSSTQGRFTSPDEFGGGPDEIYTLGKGDPEKQALPYADITQPQSLNKYQYTYNNPLRYVDPDGHCPVCIVVAVVAILASAEYANAPGPNDRIYPSGTGQRDLVSNIFIGEATGAAGRVLFAPLMRFAAGKMFANEAVGQVESRILANAAQGRAFESRVLGIVGETKNTTRIMQGEATGAAYRVPDILAQKIGGVAGEIKSTTGTLRLTNQFKDLLKYAGDTNSTLKIYLQPGAKLDAKLTGALKKSGAEVYDVVKDKVVRRNLD